MEVNKTVSGTERPTSLTKEPELQRSKWNLYVHGSACAKASRARIILIEPGGLKLEYVLKFNFKASNNVASGWRRGKRYKYFQWFLAGHQLGEWVISGQGFSVNSLLRLHEGFAGKVSVSQHYSYPKSEERRSGHTSTSGNCSTSLTHEWHKGGNHRQVIYH